MFNKKLKEEVNQIWSRMSEIQYKLYALEQGVMHDDYPKCLVPKNSGFNICKHGRMITNSITIKQNGTKK